VKNASLEFPYNGIPPQCPGKVERKIAIYA
jgi:hypothetical protein